MKRIAKFYKVAGNSFLMAGEIPSDRKTGNAWNRFTMRSGCLYGPLPGAPVMIFLLPVDVTLKPGETIKIPTRIRVSMEENWVLHLYPRSGLGFKYRLQLNNTVGIIDSDYFHSDNEGHIFAKITNDSRRERR